MIRRRRQVLISDLTLAILKRDDDEFQIVAIENDMGKFVASTDSADNARTIVLALREMDYEHLYLD